MYYANRFQFFLITEKPGFALTGRRETILQFKFPPMLHIRIMNMYIGTHFRKFTDQDFRPAISSITHIITIIGTEYENVSGGNRFTHIAESITSELSGMKPAGIVNIYCHRSNAEDVIIETENVFVCPDTPSPILRQAVSANAGTGKNHIAVSRTGDWVSGHTNTFSVSMMT